jgi:succinate dehydrogenase/fumarate reductase flavoprotein subunit
MEIKRCKINPEEIITALEAEKTLILATCAENRVTVRPMSHVNDGLTVLFQTGKDYLKMQQIRANPNVALSVGTYQIEGAAAEIGHPFDAGNEAFVKTLQAKHPGAYERWSALPDEVVVKVTVKSARQWRYVDGEPVLAEWEESEEVC